MAPYAWVLHHNLGHHRNYLHQRPHPQADESTRTRVDGQKMGRIEYTIDLLLRHQSDIFQVGLGHPKVLRSWLLMKLPLWGLLGVGLALNPLNTLLVFLVPALLTLIHTIWATYEHHAGCDTADPLQTAKERAVVAKSTSGPSIRMPSILFSTGLPPELGHALMMFLVK